MLPCLSLFTLTSRRLVVFSIAFALLAAVCVGGVAAETPTHNHNDAAWTELNQSVVAGWNEESYTLTGGHYFLREQVNLSHALIINKDITLCLNGQVLNQTGASVPVINVTSGNLTVCDCNPTISHQGYIAGEEHILADGVSETGLWMLCLDEPCTHLRSKPISGGIITGGNYSGVQLSGGNLEFKGGTIAGNEGHGAEDAGGVCVSSKSKLIVNGGTISWNKASGAQGSGGVHLHTNAQMELLSGIISNNTAVRGGGVHLSTGSVLTMTGGSIISNCAEKKDHGGGGVYIAGATLNLNGGTISNNTASAAAGGVYIMQGGKLNVNGGTISNNTAVDSHSGGIYVSLGTVSLTSGSISNNTAKNGYGGGIYLTSSSSSLTMTGGNISYNKASTNAGGGVLLADGSKMYMSSGNISWNKAKKDGGGVGVILGSSLTISGGDISNNTITSTGGGGVHLSPTATLSFSPVTSVTGDTMKKITITGNTKDNSPNNLYHSYSGTETSTIKIKNKLIDGSQINVTMQSGLGTFANSTVSDNAQYFKSDAGQSISEFRQSSGNGYDLMLGERCIITWILNDDGSTSNSTQTAAIQGTTITAPNVAKDDGSVIQWNITYTDDTTGEVVTTYSPDVTSIIVPTATAATITAEWVQPAYTITIPADITNLQETETRTVTVSNFEIPAYAVLYVNVSSANGWKLEDEAGGEGATYRMSYTNNNTKGEVSVSGTCTADNGDGEINILKATSANQALTSHLTFQLASVQYSGTFSDQLTFSVNLVPPIDTASQTTSPLSAQSGEMPQELADAQTPEGEQSSAGDLVTNEQNPESNEQPLQGAEA